LAAGHDVVLSNSGGSGTLADLVDEDHVGDDSLDLGPLAEGWRTQPGTAAYGLMCAVNPQAWDQGARPASAIEVADRASASHRGHDPRDAPTTAAIDESTDHHHQD